MNGCQIIGGRFEIADPERDLLGRGGMGDVYRGRDLQTGNLVAIKALRPDVVSGAREAVARFAREGEALRQLNHPSIVRMVHAVEEAGRHYLVMEYVPGGSLRDLLEEQGALPVERTVEIALEVADALTRAHHLGIIHRDLKPANVLLAEDGTPRLTDFGIAQLASGPRLTGADRAVGTVDYMSPEACNVEPLDRRTDVWSFGVMLYEMLAGERPFAGDSPLLALTAILTQPVPDLARLCPGASDALIDLVYRMLEKERSARIPSVRLVGAELEAILGAVRGERSALSSQPSALSSQPSALSRPSSVVYPLSSPPTSRFVTPPTPPAERPHHNLPIQPTPFVGRGAELAELERLLGDPNARLVTVLGAGGMGKTRLALEAASRETDRYPHGVFFVPLAPLQSTEAIVPTVAQALGFVFYGGDEPRQQLLDYLREKQMLLLLDNYEHLLEGADIAVDILGTASKVKVLVTSRARLGVQGEHLFHLAGMEFPDWETPEDALRYSAVKLFLQSARRVRSGFELEADDLQYISRICRLVGGMPLGILLAAAWIEMLTPAEIATEIERGLDFLEDSARDMPERQRSIRAVYNHSWSLLAEQESAVFAGLSVFRGGFTRDAAQQVAGASLRELRSLVDRSLLHRAPTGRYEMHELLRQYAAEKLDAAPDEGTAVRDGHSAYYVAALQGWEADLKCARQPAALAEMDVEIDNAHAAWSWATERGHTGDLDRAMEGMYLLYDWRSRFQEGETAFRTAAERLNKIHGPGTVDRPADGLRVLAKALLFQAMCAWQVKRTHIAQPLLQSVRDLLERPELAGHDTRVERALFLYGIGALGWDTGREATRERLEESLALFRELDNPWWVATILRLLSVLVWRSGKYDRATQWLEESLAISRTLSDQHGLAADSLWLSLVHSAQGQFERAKQLAREGLAMHQELKDQWGIANGLHVLAWPFTLTGEYTESASLMKRSVALYDDIGVPRPSAVTDLGRARMHLGEYKQARHHLEKALALAQERDMRGETARPLFVLGCVALVEGAYEEARQRLAESVAVCQEFANGLWLSKAHAVAGYVARALGDPDQARQHLRDALETITDHDSFWSVAFMLPLVALLLIDEGELARAVELYALASRYPYVSNSRWFEDVAGKQIAAAAETLPPESVAEATKRGRARDLDEAVQECLAEWGG